jgi:hypothetical protein
LRVSDPYQVESLAKESELNYFAFEAHMRKQLRELIEPYVNRATQDRELVQETKRQFNTVNKRLRDLEATVLKGADVGTIFDEYNSKLCDLVGAFLGPMALECANDDA